jgi:hypothetical protein
MQLPRRRSLGHQLGDPPPLLISDLIHSPTSAQDPTRCLTGVLR